MHTMEREGDERDTIRTVLDRGPPARRGGGLTPASAGSLARRPAGGSQPVGPRRGRPCRGRLRRGAGGGPRAVVYLQPAGNSNRPPIRYNAPFTTSVRGLCHGIESRCLPARADRPGVVVSHALLVVAIGARSRSTATTHARDATTQTLHSAPTLSGAHPQAPLRCLCTNDQRPQASPAVSSPPEDHLNPWTSAPCRHLAPLLSRCGLSLWRLGRVGQSPGQWSSQWRSLAPVALHRLQRVFSGNPWHAVAWQARRARPAGMGGGGVGGRL